jgi:hypothetical protein
MKTPVFAGLFARLTTEKQAFGRGVNKFTKCEVIDTGPKLMILPANNGLFDNQWRRRRIFEVQR